MANRIRILCLIPARSGSRGLSKKNIRLLNGKPLIAYTIEAAREAKYIEHQDIICSTDSREIQGIAERYGAAVPFIRPENLSGDTASSVSVALHAIEWMQNNRSREYNCLLLLQPTSPLRKSRHVDEAIDLMMSRNCDSVVSVTIPKKSPYIMKKMEKGRLIDFCNTGTKYTTRQEFPEVYALNGAIYLTKVDILKQKKNFYGTVCLGYEMDKPSSIDIDDIHDFQFAESLMRAGK